jgi:microcystin degradation protein MlrC
VTRIATAGLMYETNSFSPGTAGLADFQARVFVDGQ